MILKRWVEHFDEVLNVHELELQESSVVSGTQEDTEPAATIEEIEVAIKKLKNNKAPGIDISQAELLKHTGQEFSKCVHKLLGQIWDNEIIPEEWNLSIICPVHEKGDIMICSNYRGVNLLCTMYKVFSNVLFKRLAPYVERVVGDYQCGFHQGRSRTEQVFNVRQILEKCKQVGIQIHYLFVDFKAAYDSIDRTRLYLAMKEMQIPKKLVNLVRITMRNTQYQIIQPTLSEPIKK
jgi:hypothetical protein